MATTLLKECGGGEGCLGQRLAEQGGAFQWRSEQSLGLQGKLVSVAVGFGRRKGRGHAFC